MTSFEISSAFTSNRTWRYLSAFYLGLKVQKRLKFSFF